MTSYWGYVTEGFVLLVLAVWWMVNTSADIIASKQGQREFIPKMAHTWPGTNIPVEILYKISVSAFGVLGQLIYGGGHFHDVEGNFDNMNQLTFMSIYGIFLLHAVLDLLLWFRVPLIPGCNYASAATGFFWYALALHYRAQDFHEQGVGMMARTFPVFLLFPISISFVLDPLWRSGTTSSLARVFCLQTYATWCFQCAHILHDGGSFPGSDPNPDWNQADHRNVAFTAAFFGLHLCINLLLCAATYTTTAMVQRKRLGLKVDNGDDVIYGYDYSAVSTSEEDEKVTEGHSSVKLLSAYSS